jgi:hypothetical protein
MTGILIDSNNNLIVNGGNLAIGESDEQNMMINIICNKGEFKLQPLLGCELRKETRGVISERFLRKMQISLEMEGYSMKDVEMITAN